MKSSGYVSKYFEINPSRKSIEFLASNRPPSERMKLITVHLLLLVTESKSLVPDRQRRMLGGPGPPPATLPQGAADAAPVRSEVTRRPRVRDTTRDLEVPVITGEYEDDNKPSKCCRA